MAQYQNLDAGEQVDTDPPPRPHKRRRKTLSDYMALITGMAGTIAAITFLSGIATDAMPFPTKTQLANDWAANDHERQADQAQLKAVTDSVQVLMNTADMSLQLLLQSRVYAIGEALKTTSPSNPNYSALKQTLEDSEQKLRQLNRRIDR